MNDGNYYVDNMFVTNAKCHFLHSHAHSFEVVEDREPSNWHDKWIGAVRPNLIKNEFFYIEK